MTFKKSRNVSKALVIKEKDNDKERMDKRAVNQKRLMAMKRALRCGYGCGGCGGGGGCGSGGRLRNRWQPIADMSVKRCGPTSGVLCGRLVVVGGYNYDGDIDNYLSSGEMYDPRTNRWQPIADMSVRRWAATSGVVCGRLVVVGGENDDGGSGGLSSGEMYDPRTNRWQPIANMSVKRQGATSGVVCGRLVVVGGYNNDGDIDNYLSSGEMYDPRTNRWQPIADMSVKRENATSGVVCGRLVVVGGGNGETGILSSGEMYDPRTNRWQPIADMSVKRQYATSGVVCGRLVVVGGDGETGTLSSGEMYDPRTNRWQPIADMSVKRQYATSGVVCGRLVVVGGTPDDSGNPLSSGEMYY